jgi:hypothetical protein
VAAEAIRTAARPKHNPADLINVALEQQAASPGKFTGRPASLPDLDALGPTQK